MTSGSPIIITGRSAVCTDRYLTSSDSKFSWANLPRPQNPNQILRSTRPPTALELERRIAESDLLKTLPQPLHCLTGSVGVRRKGQQFVCHSWSGPLAENALIELEPRIYICSPEQRFLQAAGFLSVEDCLIFAFELCGGYIKMPREESGCIPCNPRTNPQLLKRYLDQIGSTRGCKRAAQVLKMVRSGSRSPMESALATLLALPRRRGRFELARFLLNPKIETNPNFEKNKISRKRYCDIYFPDIKLDIEYNSHLHDGRDGVSSDVRREHDLMEAGIEVIVLLDETVKSVFEMTRIAESIERKLGLRRKPLTTRELVLRNELFEKLIPGKIVPCDPYTSEC
jgi:hypothetical protein